MSETLTVGVSKEQRELLLRGLRFVRSSVTLDMRDPSPEVDADRKSQLHDIAALVQQLEEARPAGTATRV